MLRLIMILIVLLPANALAFDSWSKADIQRELTYSLITLVDIEQSKRIFKHNGWVESNPLLDRNPTDSQLNQYWALGMLAHVFVADILPSEKRKYWQFLTIGYHTKVIIRSSMIEASFNF